MKILQTAVVGLGRIAWGFHLPQIACTPGFSLAAVVDPIAERRLEAQQKFAVESTFGSLQELLSCQPPDLLVIASPTPMHEEQCIAAMAAGCDVFCDKPIAPSFDSAQRIFSACRYFGRKLTVYQPHRYKACMSVLRQIIDSGNLGRIYRVERHAESFNRRSDWQAFAENGGGMLLNYGSHFIDQLLALFPGEIVSLEAYMDCVVSQGNAEDIVDLRMELAEDITLLLSISQAAAIPMPAWRILGTHGTAVGNDGQWQLRYFIPEEVETVPLSRDFAAPQRLYNREKILWHEETLSEGDGTNYYSMLYDYYARNLTPPVFAKETLALCKIIDCARDSAKKKSFVPNAGSKDSKLNFPKMTQLLGTLGLMHTNDLRRTDSKKLNAEKANLPNEI